MHDADGNRQIVDASFFDEAFCLGDIGVVVGPMHALADIRNFAEFGLDGDAKVVGDLDDAAGGPDAG